MTNLLIRVIIVVRRSMLIRSRGVVFTELTVRKLLRLMVKLWRCLLMCCRLILWLAGTYRGMITLRLLKRSLLTSRLILPMAVLISRTFRLAKVLIGVSRRVSRR